MSFLKPETYSTIETRDRMTAFNDIFSRHVVQHYPNLFWTRQYWEYVKRHKNIISSLRNAQYLNTTNYSGSIDYNSKRELHERAEAW